MSLCTESLARNSRVGCHSGKWQLDNHKAAKRCLVGNLRRRDDFPRALLLCLVAAVVGMEWVGAESALSVLWLREGLEEGGGVVVDMLESIRNFASLKVFSSRV